MITLNSKGKEQLESALEAINRRRVNKSTENIRNYQEEVRRRLREKKVKEERK